MPTGPLESIIYRDLAKANANELSEVASPLLIELVNYGSNAIVRCATSSQGKKDEDLAVLSLYRPRGRRDLQNSVLEWEC